MQPMTNQNCKWFIVIKYTQDNWLGTMVDAVFAPSSVDALYLVTRGPVEPGEYFRAFEPIGPAQEQKAIALYQERRKADREWNLLVAHFEDAWLRAEESIDYRGDESNH